MKLNIEDFKKALLKVSLKDIFIERKEPTEYEPNIDYIFKYEINFNFDNYDGDKYKDLEKLLQDNDIIKHLIKITEKSYINLISDKDNQGFKDYVLFFYNDEHPDNKISNYEEIPFQYIEEYSNHLKSDTNLKKEHAFDWLNNDNIVTISNDEIVLKH